MSSSNGVSVSGSGTIASEVEVMAKATRRRFSAEYKLKILREAEACTQPALPQAVWINRPRTLDEHDQAPVAVEPGERVARPTVWRSALAGRILDGEVSSSSSANAREVELAVAH